jgi:hypothetical protein
MVVSGQTSQNANQWTITPSDVSVWPDWGSNSRLLALFALEAGTLTTQLPRLSNIVLNVFNDAYNCIQDSSSSKYTPSIPTLQLKYTDYI